MRSQKINMDAKIKEFLRYSKKQKLKKGQTYCKALKFLKPYFILYIYFKFYHIN